LIGVRKENFTDIQFIIYHAKWHSEYADLSWNNQSQHIMLSHKAMQVAFTVYIIY